MIEGILQRGMKTIFSKKERVSKVRYTLFSFGYLMDPGFHLCSSKEVHLFLIHPFFTARACGRLYNSLKFP